MSLPKTHPPHYTAPQPEFAASSEKTLYLPPRKLYLRDVEDSLPLSLPLAASDAGFSAAAIAPHHVPLALVHDVSYSDLRQAAKFHGLRSRFHQ